MPKLFQRKKEDFICEHCSFEVRGTGYTNHCPRCLWSKHVDIHPGDREALCGGMMEPTSSILENGKYSIFQKCLTCGFVRKNKIEKEDNFDVVVSLSAIL